MNANVAAAATVPAAKRRAMSRLSGAVAAMAGIAVAAYLYILTWNGTSAGFLSDEAVYLLMADAFSPFRSADPALSAYVLRQSIFPPLYPWLLAILGAGSGALLWAHVITTTALLLASIVFAAWVRLLTPGWKTAALLAAILALLPGTLLSVLEMMSEAPYLLFSMLAIWLVERSVAGRKGLAWAAACVALAALTRTAGLSLVVAFGLWLFRHRVKGRIAWFLLSVTPSLLWIGYKKWTVGTQGGGYQQFWLWLVEQFRERPAEFLPAFIRDQGSGLWNGLAANLDLVPTRLTHVVLAAIVLLAAPVCLHRLRRWNLDALYLLVGIVMTFLYPFPSAFARLLLPWVPIILAYAGIGAWALSTRFGATGGRWLPGAFLAMLLISLLPSVGYVVHRLLEPVAPALAHWKHTRYWYRIDRPERIIADLRMRQGLIEAARDTGRLVPPGACVFGVQPAIGMLYSHRVFELPPPPSASAAEFAERSRACRYFLLLPAPGTIAGESAAPFYPYDRLRAQHVEVVHAWQRPGEAEAADALLLRSIAPAGSPGAPARGDGS